MQRRVIPLILLILSVVLVGCAGGDDAAQDATPLPPVTETSTLVSAEGFLVPARQVDLVFQSNGDLVEIVAAEGSTVSAGEAIARLDDADQQIALASAQAGLTTAQSGIVNAEAAIAQAEANLAQTQAGATPEQVAQAQAAVTRAEASLAQAAAGATEEQIAVAQARVDILRAQLNQVLAGTRDEQLRASLATVRRTEAALRLAQSDYDEIAYAADSDQAQPIALALEQATLDYEAARANYEALLNGATSQEVAVVNAQLAEGRAALAQTESGPTAEQLAVAQAGVLEAEAALDVTEAGATTEQIAVAQAGVTIAQAGLEQAEANLLQAEVAVEQAELALSRTELTAPFDGSVVTINAEEGEFVGAGTPFATLADFSTWHIETDDLTEIDVVNVAPGQRATVTFDALPDQSFEGTVLRIKDRSELKAGDVTYTVIVELPNPGEAPIRWGMTAFVEIETE